jgi:hypothetical protein
MEQRVRVTGTGVYIDSHPAPERSLAQAASTFGRHLSPQDRADIAQWRAGEAAFVRLTPFVEFDDGCGQERWEGTPQGPYAISLTRPATSTLLNLVETLPGDLMADLGISELHASRFAVRAAPRRIDLEPGLAEVLRLD